VSRMLWTATLGPNLDSAGRARAEAHQALEDAGVPPNVIGDAMVVLGEMASNAARHARTDFTVTVTLGNEILRLEVFDRDTRPPALLGIDLDSTSGRGLHMVSGLADDWGWQTAEEDGVSGKIVWAEFSVTESTESA
jgi:anti-sigma regulatory factor (Ser/Thr protein kinase)